MSRQVRDFRGSEDFSFSNFKKLIFKILIKVFILGFLLGGFIYEKQQAIQSKDCKSAVQQLESKR